MGLDAFIYCDCIEKGLIKKPHPLPDLLIIDETGFPELSSKKDELVLLHNQWIMSKPCEHQDFILVFELLGNIATVGFIRSIIKKINEVYNLDFPIIQNKVIHSGIHSGDYLPIKDVYKLKEEITQLEILKNNNEFFFNKMLKDKKDKMIYSNFFETLSNLIKASLEVSKPIVF